MSDLTAHNNDRALERYIVNCDVDVYDSVNDVYIGRLVNIHAQGLMVIGDVLLDEDRLYELDMHLPNDNNVLKLCVDCLWVRPADQVGKYWVGFTIIELPAAASEEIHKLIALWCNN
ncbi:MAG TPA: PilZ domain-containing protein [Cellvibrio sp.]|nr:PilZ domain-containing protein [Cellvibrio sp.]